MAFQKTVTYTPFGEQSFGFPNNELATNYNSYFANDDTIVEVRIQHMYGNFDTTTGHLSTPSSGTAVSTYNPRQRLWVVKGERSDVDTVLSELVFYPSDKPESRPKTDENTSGFEVTLYRDNLTSGNYSATYTDEEPPAIGDTVFRLSLYNASGTQQGNNEDITFDPVEPSYGNQRPYWSTEPSRGQDVSSSSFNFISGYYLDFGTISHGVDTENVTVSCEFREYDTETNLGYNYGYFPAVENLYIGDKIPEKAKERKKFTFTGSVAEAQAFLNNVRFRKTSLQRTFDMYLTVSDGVVGSQFTKTIWFGRDLEVSTIPNQSFTEDTTAKFDFATVIFENEDDLTEVNSFKAVITLDATGTSGATSFGTTTTVDTETYSSGVLTIIDSNLDTLKTAIRNLEFVPVADFNSDFTFTVQFTFENTTVGSSYTHTAQTVNVTGNPQHEATGLTQTINWQEDRPYFFSTFALLTKEVYRDYDDNGNVTEERTVTVGSAEWYQAKADGLTKIRVGMFDFYMAIERINNLIDIVHPENEDFEISFEFVDSERSDKPLSEMGEFTVAVDSTSIAGTYITLLGPNRLTEAEFNAVTRTQDGNTITLSGTRDALNTYMDALGWKPFPDYATNFTVNVTLSRTSGDLTFETPSTGVLTFNVDADDPEISYTAPQEINWQEDVPVSFASGFQILDESVDNPYSPSYDADFKVTIEARYEDGSQITEGDITLSIVDADDYEDEVNVSGIGISYQPLVVTGKKININRILNRLLMTPRADFTATQGFNVYYTIERGTPSDLWYSVFTDNSEDKKTKFDKGEPSPEAEIPNNIIYYGKERITDMFGQYKIVDVAEDKEYEVHFTMDNVGEGLLRATASGDATVTWVKDDKRLKISGNKQDINNTIRTLEYIPDFGFDDNFNIFYYQRQVTDNIVQHDGTEYWNVDYDASLPKYQVDSVNRFYFEDAFNQDSLKLTSLKNLDGAAEINAALGYNNPLHYEVELDLVPSTEIYFTGGAAVEDDILASGIVEQYPSAIRFTGSRDECNQLIKQQLFDGYPDQNDNVEVKYTQLRWYNRNMDDTQANGSVTGVTIEGTTVGEVDFTSQTQLITNLGAIDINGNKPTSKYLREFKKRNDNTTPIVAYDQPMNIIDNSKINGETLYKLSVIGHNFPETVTVKGFGYRSKEDFHKTIEDGLNDLIEIPENGSGVKHGRTYNVIFRVSRLLGDGTELDNLEEQNVVFEYRDSPRLYRNPKKYYEHIEHTTYYIGSGEPYKFTQSLSENVSFLKENFTEVVSGEIFNGQHITDWTGNTRYNNIPINLFWRYENDIDVVSENESIGVYKDPIVISGNTRTLSLTRSDANLIKFSKIYTPEEITQVDNPETLPEFRNLEYSIPNIISMKYDYYDGVTLDRNYEHINMFEIYTDDLQTGEYEITLEVTDHYGLVGRKDIVYRNTAVYSQTVHGVEQFWNSAIVPPADTDIIAHDSGDDLGAFTISPRNLLHQDDTDDSNAVLCSHFWVSKNKWGFAQLNSNISPVDWYPQGDDLTMSFNTPYALRTDNTMFLGYRHQTPALYGRSSNQGFACPPDWNKIQRVGKQSVNTGLDLEVSFTSALQLLNGETNITTDTTLEDEKIQELNQIGDPVMWFGTSNVPPKTMAHQFKEPRRDVRDYATGMMVRDVPETDVNNFLEKNVKSDIYDGTYAYNFISARDELKLLAREYVYNVKTGEQYLNDWSIDLLKDDDVISEESTYYSYSQRRYVTYQVNDLRATSSEGSWDYAIGEFEFYRKDNFLFYRPKSICITYSYRARNNVGDYQTRNECWILEPEKDNASINEFGNPASTKPTLKITRYYKDTVKGPSWDNSLTFDQNYYRREEFLEYAKWARRTPKDNSGRILAVRDGNGTYLLPSGHVVSLAQETNRIYNFDTDRYERAGTRSTAQTFDKYPVENLTTDISKYNIEYFLRMPNGDITFVATGEDKNQLFLDDGTGNYNIVLLENIRKHPWYFRQNNMAVHMAKDRLSPNTVYFMIRDTSVYTNKPLSPFFYARLIRLEL